MWTNLTRFRKIIYIGLFLFGPACLLLAQNRSPRLTGDLSSGLVDLSVFLQSGVIYMVGGVSDVYFHYVSSVNQFDLIHKYRAEAAKSVTLQKLLHELSLENQQLRGLFNSVSEVGGNYFSVARVTGRKGAPLSRIIFINQGSAAGIVRGDAVINEYGAVGQVIAAGEHSSEVLLTIDSASAVDVIVQTSRARGILRGGGDARKYELEVRDFDHLYTVTKGEVIVTSGLGAKFPVGVPVGEVISVQKQGDGVYLNAKIRPFVDFARLEHVLVIKSNESSLSPSIGDLIKFVTHSPQATR